MEKENTETLLGSFVIFEEMRKDPDYGLRFLDDLQKEFPESQAFLVGGAVRDFLQNRTPKDLDFVVGQVEVEKLIEFFKNHYDTRHLNLVGKRFGVISYLPGSKKIAEPYEIALPRKEYAYGTGGARDFEVQSDPHLPIEEDLSRRDFTINALALNLRTQELIDPYGGQQDIQAKVIRAVGDPAERFNEDYSRMLRAIRFGAQLGFEIEPNTWQALLQMAEKVAEKKEGKNIVPNETVWKEFSVAFDSDPDKTLDLYDETGLLKQLFPEIQKLQGVPQPPEFHQEGDVYEHTKLVLENLPQDAPLALKLAALYHDIGKPETLEMPKEEGERIKTYGHDKKSGDIVRNLAEKWHWTNELKDQVQFLVRHHMALMNEKVVEEMRPTRIKAYFLDDPQLGQMLIDLVRADMAGSVGKDGKPVDRRFEILEDRINNLREQLEKSKTKDYSHIINGQTIMQEFNLQPGLQVGEKLEKAQEYITGYIAEHGTEPTVQDVLDFLKD